MRKMRINTRPVVAILMISFFIFFNCEDTTNSENPAPGKVQLVSKSPEDEAVETGIDAEYILGPPPPRNGIIIQWHPVKDDDLAGYRVYRSTSDSSAAFALIATVRTHSIPGRIDTSYFDQSTIAGTRYYYRISAEDADQQGPRSNAADYKLENVCILHFPPPPSGAFEWEWPINQQPDSFIFRLSRRTLLGTYDALLIKKFSDYSPTPNWTLPELGLDSLEAGQYLWRVDIIGSEDNNGSESDWLPFTIQ
jgi:hypothetical protein